MPAKARDARSTPAARASRNLRLDSLRSKLFLEAGENHELSWCLASLRFQHEELSSALKDRKKDGHVCRPDFEPEPAPACEAAPGSPEEAAPVPPEEASASGAVAGCQGLRLPAPTVLEEAAAAEEGGGAAGWPAAAEPDSSAPKEQAAIACEVDVLAAEEQAAAETLQQRMLSTEGRLQRLEAQLAETTESLSGRLQRVEREVSCSGGASTAAAAAAMCGLRQQPVVAALFERLEAAVRGQEAELACHRTEVARFIAQLEGGLQARPAQAPTMRPSLSGTLANALRHLEELQAQATPAADAQCTGPHAGRARAADIGDPRAPGAQREAFSQELRPILWALAAAPHSGGAGGVTRAPEASAAIAAAVCPAPSGSSAASSSSSSASSPFLQAAASPPLGPLSGPDASRLPGYSQSEPNCRSDDLLGSEASPRLGSTQSEPAGCLEDSLSAVATGEALPDPPACLAESIYRIHRLLQTLERKLAADVVTADELKAAATSPFAPRRLFPEAAPAHVGGEADGDNARGQAQEYAAAAISEVLRDLESAEARTLTLEASLVTEVRQCRAKCAAAYRCCQEAGEQIESSLAKTLHLKGGLTTVSQLVRGASEAARQAEEREALGQSSDTQEADTLSPSTGPYTPSPTRSCFAGSPSPCPPSSSPSTPSQPRLRRRHMLSAPAQSELPAGLQSKGQVAE